MVACAQVLAQHQRVCDVLICCCCEPRLRLTTTDAGFTSPVVTGLTANAVDLGLTHATLRRRRVSYFDARLRWYRFG